MRTRAVRVRPNREKNFVHLNAERQAQAIPVPVTIKGAEANVSSENPHRTDHVIGVEISMSWSNNIAAVGFPSYYLPGGVP